VVLFPNSKNKILSQFVVQDFFPRLNYNRRGRRHTLTLDAIILAADDPIRVKKSYERLRVLLPRVTSQRCIIISIVVLILERLSRNLWDARTVYV